MHLVKPVPPSVDLNVELGSLLAQPEPVNGSPGPLYAFLRLPSQSRSIRVLDLDPVPSRFTNHEKWPLSGELRVVSLQDCPRFIALSYVWGGYSTPRDLINCNGNTSLEITTNCRNALIALRKHYGALTIWIDAICIDQQNILERNQQVSLMEEIYSWAERTLVWLGPGDESSRKALQWLERASYGSFFDAFMRIGSLPVPKQQYRYKLTLLFCIMWCAIRDNLSFLGRLVRKYHRSLLIFLSHRLTYVCQQFGLV
jgi:hypothetical protein